MLFANDTYQNTAEPDYNENPFFNQNEQVQEDQPVLNSAQSLFGGDENQANEELD